MGPKPRNMTTSNLPPAVRQSARKGASKSPKNRRGARNNRDPALAAPGIPSPQADEACFSPGSVTDTDMVDTEPHPSSPGDSDVSVIPDPPDLRHGFDPSKDPSANDDFPSAVSRSPRPFPIPSPLITPNPSILAKKSKSVMFPPGTPYGPATTPQPSGRDILFCSVKLTIDDKSMDGLILRLTAILKRLSNLGIEFQLLGYDPDLNMPPVTTIDAIGSKLTQLQRYFHGLYLAKTTWCQWRVSWIPPYAGYESSHFLTDAGAVFNEFEAGIYAKWLQFPFTATSGWIFKSLEHTDLITLHLFLETELKDQHNFDAPFALYRKVPFLGQATPADTKHTSVQASGRAIHVDTVDSHCTLLWQHLNRLLKSAAMKKLHNFEWKFIPQYHARRSTSDQIQLKTTAAKQKLVHPAISTISCSYFLNIEFLVAETGLTMRRFLLDRKLNGTQGPPIILAIDRDAKRSDEYIFTAAKEHQEALTTLVHFSPIILSREFGFDNIKRGLSSSGLEALDDQYWDDQFNGPRSRFSDSLKEDHMDERDIRIVIENLPESLLGVKRPGDTAGLDFDDLTQPSFNTQGQSKAKQPRFASPRASEEDTSHANHEYVLTLEREKAAQNQRIAALEVQLARLLATSLQASPASAPPPRMQLDESP